MRTPTRPRPAGWRRGRAIDQVEVELVAAAAIVRAIGDLHQWSDAVAAVGVSERAPTLVFPAGRFLLEVGGSPALFVHLGDEMGLAQGRADGVAGGCGRQEVADGANDRLLTGAARAVIGWGKSGEEEWVG